MISDSHRRQRFLANPHDAVIRAVPGDRFGQRERMTRWAVANWPDGNWESREGIERHLRDRLSDQGGFRSIIWVTILGALLSAVISALINHWFSDNVRMGL